MTHSNDYFKQVKQAANGRWFEIFTTLAPSLNDAIKRCPKHGPCPVNGGKDGFRLFKDSNTTGGGISNADGAKPNGFELLMWLWDCDFITTLKAVSEFLGMNNSQRQDYTPKAPVRSANYSKTQATSTDKHLGKCRAYLRKVWSSTIDLTSPKAKLARIYLNSRSLDLKQLNLHGLSKTIRFHPSLELYHDNVKIGSYPALVTMVRYEDGNPACLHRTYLDKTGHKLKLSRKGEAVASKKLTTSCEDRMLSGGSIQLGIPQSNYLHITEGIETALSVMQVKHEPVWPCISSTLLAKFNPPKDINHIFIWADKDREKNGKRAGYDSAVELLERMAEQGVECTIMYPSSELGNRKSVDWNDELAEHGENHFPPHHLYLWQKAIA
ncbi:hypothetical protein VHA01S_080_00070 [Vibrio halioticoli NBRC 102217]|uniref:DNA primase/helicase Gp4 N-terminal Bacteriophage T7-like domain-containing protein n=1 Tax=Vibrio halioticoli NBRC 102217 TaxID=1219072 RepID=V5FRI9_9VIBR|nr:toprim domain-containing protein [Vibrio halioticoli]GAD91267.1 hypothetical protein VHA01S_080_00070 [Vibrio halioticoli NBRC 102217]